MTHALESNRTSRLAPKHNVGPFMAGQLLVSRLTGHVESLIGACPVTALIRSDDYFERFVVPPLQWIVPSIVER